MTTHDTPEARAALSAALYRVTLEDGGYDADAGWYYSGGRDDLAAAILATLDGWALVPKDTSLAWDTGFQDGLGEGYQKGQDFAILHARLVHGCDHGLPAADTPEAEPSWAVDTLRLIDQRDKAEAEIARLRTVVDAAHNWRDDRQRDAGHIAADFALIGVLAEYDSGSRCVGGHR
jgi:hypothetical protein